MSPLEVEIGPNYRLVLAEQRTRSGQLALSLRVHDVRDIDRPGRGGFSLLVAHLPAVIEALAQAEVFLRDEPEYLAP